MGAWGVSPARSFFSRRGGVGESRFDFGGVVGEEGKIFLIACDWIGL